MPKDRFGWVANLFRWARQDVDVVGTDRGLYDPSDMRGNPYSNDSLLDDDILDVDPGGSMNEYLNQAFTGPSNRADAYRIYEQMDTYDLVSSILDLYAEDSTQMDPDTGRTLWYEAEDPVIMSTLLHGLDTWQVETEITSQCRDIAKFGDVFERLAYASEIGIQRMHPQPSYQVSVKQDKTGKLEGYQQLRKKFKGQTNDISHPWDYVHFKLRGKNRLAPYGTSMLDALMRPWRQAVILEDHMMMYQISRHPDRNVVRIDTGTAGEAEARRIVQRVRQAWRKRVAQDPTNKKINTQFNAWTPMEDVFLGLRQGSQTNIDKLSGSANALEITPLEYVIKKLFAAARAPKSYFGFEDTSGDNTDRKTNLTNQDVRYARGCKRLQRALKVGYRFMGEFHLMLKGGGEANNSYNWRERGDFTVHMGPVSMLEEMERLEIDQIRVGVAQSVLELGRENSAIRQWELTNYIMKNILRVPSSDMKRIMRTRAEAAAAAKAQADGGFGGFEYLEPEQKKELIQEQADKIEAEMANVGDAPDKDTLRTLSEAMRSNQKLRHTIELGVQLWRNDGDEVIETQGRLLPKEAKELTDEMTSEDLHDEIMHIIDDEGKAGS